MKNKLVRNSLIAGAVSLLAIGTGYLAFRGTSKGIIFVSNVYELQNAIRTAADYDVIVVSTNGSPYNLSEMPCMHTNGYLYVTNSITIRGESGNPADVVISAVADVGSYDVKGTNRIFYVRAEGCKFEGLTISQGLCSTNSSDYNQEGLDYGGGIYWGAGICLGLATNECVISNCNFELNRGIRGGAIALRKGNDSTTKIVDCQFNNNEAEENGGALYNSAMTYGCSFSANQAAKYGGAIANAVTGDLSIVVSNCYFVNNVAGGAGGAAYCCSMLEGCRFVQNNAKNGGAASRSILNNCIGDNNTIASGGKGMELYDCIATGYSFTDKVNGAGESRFHDVLLHRSRLCVTNGLLFSGWYEVRSSTITDGTNFALSVASPGKWDYDHLDDEGRATWKPSRLVNCTIANNKAYSFLSSGRIGEGLEIYNTIFDGNTTWINGGTKVNLNLATNGYYKTVDMTYAQRYIALGWDGELTNTKVRVGDMGGYQIVIDTMNLMSEYDGRIVISERSGKSEYVSVSYEQYYFAHGWNGDTSISEFTAKSAFTEVAVDSPTRFDKIMEPWTNSQTWYDYYMEFEFDGVRWDGVSDYIYHALVECAFSRSVSNVFTRATQTAPAGICSSFFTIPAIEYETDWDNEDWIWRCYTEPIDFDFFGELEPRNPYAIKLSSPAYHRNKYYYGIEETIYLDWMQTALDLRGVPRLASDESWSRDTLDIGAYQATELRKPTKCIIRIR